MKAISTDPLWAWAIMAGHRPIENWTEPIRYRGELAVHSEPRTEVTREIREWFQRNTFWIPPPNDVVDGYAGRILGTVQLIGCSQPSLLLPSEQEFARGPWCLRLRTPQHFVRPIEHDPFIGFTDWSTQTAT
ncbi:MAG: hypothetical protein AAFU85_17190 [Planctomycetota bacterium]